MLTAILSKIGGGLAGLAFTALGARLGLKMLDKLNWTGIFNAIEEAAHKLSRLGNHRFNQAFYEPFEKFFQEKLTEAVVRVNKGLDRDDTPVQVNDQTR